MLAALSIFGDGDPRVWSNGPLALGRDIARSQAEDRFDDGPVVGGEGRFVLVADVRLDNRDELITQLAMDRDRASVISDAAMLMAAFERWGDRFLPRILGDYALALWDGRERRLLLARDPFGQRPLFYHHDPTLFAFAGMIPGLHALAGIPKVVDEERLQDFVGMVPTPSSRTFYARVSAVDPGHAMTITARGVASLAYRAADRTPIRFRNPDDYVAGLREQLDAAVFRRLRGASDVGAHLSAGLDSGAVTSTAARLLQGAKHQLVAFTAVPRPGYDGPVPTGRLGDEAQMAGLTAAMHPAVFHELVASHESTPLDHLDRNLALTGRPALNPCNTGWSFAINDAARALNVRVMLTGQLGNFSLSHSGGELLAELAAKGRALAWIRAVRDLQARRPGAWAGLASQALGSLMPGQLRSGLKDLVGRSERPGDRFTVLHPALHQAAARRIRMSRGSWAPISAYDARLNAISRVDLGASNKAALGGWRIDQRDPTSDVRLVDYCLRVPSEYYLREGVPRWLARQALSDRLPAAVLNETRKGYQSADWHERLSAARPMLPALMDALSTSPLASRTLDLGRMRDMVETWPSAGWASADTTLSYRRLFLRAISAGHFIRSNGA